MFRCIKLIDKPHYIRKHAICNTGQPYRGLRQKRLVQPFLAASRTRAMSLPALQGPLRSSFAMAAGNDQSIMFW